jgi:hemerythrin-like domain-containing protein
VLIQPRRAGGLRTSSDQSLLELLMACHERIRRFTAMAVALTEPSARTRPVAEVTEAADGVRRYLAVALPLHAADEELSITPRLRAHQPALVPSLERMCTEHTEHAPLLAEVIGVCEAIVRSPDELPALAGRLRPAALALSAALLAHIEEEERVIFPAIEALPTDEQAAIVAELRARRAPPT